MSESQTLRSLRRTAPPAAPSRARILLVDDRPDNLLALEAILESLGHTLVKARSGAEALKLSLDMEFAVILLDVQMPEMDGFETVTLLRQRERTANVPVIFVTAIHTTRVEIFRGYSLGAADYVLKPLTPEILRSKVKFFADQYLQSEMLKDRSHRLMRLREHEHAIELDAIQTQRNRFFTLSVDMMAILGFDGRIREANPAWADIVGLGPLTVVGRRLIDLVHEDDVQPTRERWSSLIAGADVAALDVRVRTAGGGHRWLSWKLAPYPQESICYAVARDVTEMRRTQDALRESEARYRDLFEGSTDLIPIVDTSGRLQFANRALRALLGRDDADVRRLEFADLAAPPDRERARAGFAAALATGAPQRLEIEFLSGSGHPVPVEGTLGRHTVAGHPVHVHGIFRDVSQRREVDRLKGEFISIVSHELRTPLTSIQGALGLMAGGALGHVPDGMRQVVEIASRNCERLARLTQDILELEKLESGRARVTLREIDVLPFLRHALDVNLPYAKTFGVTFALAADAAESRIMGDVDRLHAVITNLLSNAAKFSPTGDTVTVGVRRLQGSTRVSVTDRGPGVPESFRDRIFQKFAQGDSSDSRHKGGSGLGLCIAKANIESLGGAIGFRNEPERGATFYFDIPEIAIKEDPRGPEATP